MATLNPHTSQPFSTAYHVMRMQARALPVSQHIPQLLEAIRNNQVTVIIGETGSGKSTQVPKHILESLFDMFKGKVCLTQPRRLAAQSVARRIAEEMDVQLGTFVGLRHRDHDSTSNITHLEVNTDGTTVAMAKADPDMSDFGFVIIDEAHEHSLSADILLGHLKQLLNTRVDLRLIVMSATIDPTLFTNFFPQCVVEKVSGRQHKVTVNYLEQPPSDLIDEIIDTILFVHNTQVPGDILVFCSGKGEISKVIAGVKKAEKRFARKDMGPLTCYPLHSSLSASDQNIAINALPPSSLNGKHGRKVIVATNSAETSLTIDGIVHIIDSCKSKLEIWNPSTESWKLIEQPVSKASVLHRIGRAGRTCKGMAWLMCTERGYHEGLVEHSVPQVMQGDLLSECLTILKLGHDPLTFDYIVPPVPETMQKAMELLHLLRATDCSNRILERGKNLAAIPTNVYAALTMLQSPEYGCSDEIITIMAMIEATDGGSGLYLHARERDERANLNRIKRSFQHASGDHVTLLNIYMEWRAACHKKEEREFLERNMLQGSALRSADQTRLHYLAALKKIAGWKHCWVPRDEPSNYSYILQALAAGYYLQVAKRDPRWPYGYQLVRSGMNVSLPKDTGLDRLDDHTEWVIYNQCFNDPSQGMILKVVSGITPEVMVAAEPDYWWHVEFLPEGHIKEGPAQVLSNMKGSSEDVRTVEMPAPGSSVRA
ncbi:pre-mRNA-splicing factor ATP-dependent RNA helicase PRP43 [Aureobasidium sp. EXF-10727]|nr:pre-mRNA-splicing factor ATP-dependent RNA helicase PRP43 [Aureobasidium sp. EXF-10727]